MIACATPSAPGPTSSASTTSTPCGGFDFPVGPPDAEGYYDAQPFGANSHLGSDYNGNGGGDSDLGDPVHAVAPGEVVLAEDLGDGWGNVVRVVHRCDDRMVESLYAHLDVLYVTTGMTIGRGTTLGEIGTAHGQYLAHLHFELRETVGMPTGGGYGDDASGYVDPTAFIRAHRP
jgi:murein DD-endopeptidase MepM/ murein hydrolase activator NlpD